MFETSPLQQRPYTSVVLAMSVDGKIADVHKSHPTFGSKQDYEHLERQVSAADAVLVGATTLRSAGTAMRVLNPELIQQRLQSGKPAQPIQMVCSRSGNIDPTLRFFRQPIVRWLLTTELGAQRWKGHPGFDQVIILPLEGDAVNWSQVWSTLKQHSIERMAVLGGGEMVAYLLAANVIDELQITLCPILLGGRNAPSVVAGPGFLQDHAPRLELRQVTQAGHELFLHYQVRSASPPPEERATFV